MSRTSLVITILGADRPGLVESIARVVADHGGDWLESRMAHLAGQFAGVLRVEAPAERAEALAAALRGLTEAGLETVVHPDPSVGAPVLGPTVLLDLVGQDRPGIVREVSRVLASQGVNVEELTTERFAAATTGQQLFSARATLRLPPGADEQRLRAALEAVATDMMVDVRLGGAE